MFLFGPFHGQMFLWSYSADENSVIVKAELPIKVTSFSMLGETLLGKIWPRTHQLFSDAFLQLDIDSVRSLIVFQSVPSHFHLAFCYIYISTQQCSVWMFIQFFSVCHVHQPFEVVFALHNIGKWASYAIFLMSLLLQFLHDDPDMICSDISQRTSLQMHGYVFLTLLVMSMHFRTSNL